MSLETYEYFSLIFTQRILSHYTDLFLENANQIDFEELLLNLSRQGKGKATSYNFSLYSVIEHYLNNDLNEEQEFELRCRIASSSIYNLALERFTFNSIVRYLTEYGFDYNNFFYPNTADFAIMLNNATLDQINEVFELEFEFNFDYAGIVLFVDSKSIMYFKNQNDATIKGKELGKCEIKWNQISYTPPALRESMRVGNSVLNQRSRVVRNEYRTDQGNYYLVSIFLSDLTYLPHNSLFFRDPLVNLGGNYFNHQLFLICCPNGYFEGEYYDSFFQATKQGYYKDTINGITYRYPKDARIGIKNSAQEYLRFMELEENPNRFCYIPNIAGRFQALRLEDNEVITDSFNIF